MTKKPKKKPKSKRNPFPQDPQLVASLLPSLPAKFVCSNNFVATDEGITAIHCDNERDLDAAMRTSEKAAIYCSPVLFSVRNAVILTGSHREAYLRARARRDALKRFGQAARELVGAFAKWR